MTESRRSEPPIAPVRPNASSLHGEQRVDGYGWLRDIENPEVRSYLAAENAFWEASMNELSDLQQTLYGEMTSRFKEADVSVAQRLDDFLYYYRSARDRQYQIYCRRRGSQDAPEEVILDVNELAEGYDYFHVGALRVSPDHSLLAYSVDSEGDEVFSIVIKQLGTGELLSDRIPDTSGQVAWSGEDAILLYTAIDQSRRSHELKLHVLGTDPAEDRVLHREPDQAFHLVIGKSKSKKYLYLSIDSLTTSEVRFALAADPMGEWKVVEPRRLDVGYSVEHQQDRFIILSDEGTGTFRLFETPVESPSRKNWNPIKSDEDFLIEECEVLRDHLVLLGRKDGLPQVLVTSRAGNGYYLDFPEPTYTVDLVGNPDYESSVVRLSYSSLVTPHSIFDFDIETRSLHLQKHLEVASSYESSLYRTERLFCTAPDGVRVPISLVYRADLMRRDGSNPLVLTAYGAYGETFDPEFILERLSLLDRGFAYAIAHVRGGGEFGETWHDEGRVLNKKNTFADFIASAEHLIAERYTSPNGLIAQGRSAGGLLIGAVVNVRSDLFRVAIADVPFVDVISTMMDPALPLTPREYEEWGDPSDPLIYEYMKTYSPYDCVSAQPYPHMLVSMSIKDARVPYWEPAKWVAKLRAMKTDDNTLLLRVLPAGHPGVSGRLDYVNEEAFEQAFLVQLFDRSGHISKNVDSA